MSKIVGTALSLLLLAAAGLHAAEVPASERGTLDSFAEGNRTCTEWSDGCAVCKRHDYGPIACSLPGIACEPTPVACRDTRPDADTPGPKIKERPPKPN